MNRKQQRRIDSVQNIISPVDLEREITRTETRISSARDSMDDFRYVLTIGILIGCTSIGTAGWYEMPLLAASYAGLKLALAVFAFFSLKNHIEIWINTGPDEEYRNALTQRQAMRAGESNRLVVKASPRKEEDFQ